MLAFSFQTKPKTRQLRNMSDNKHCPKCHDNDYVKSGIIKGRQRYKCKNCNYYFTVQKLGKRIDDYYVVKALQLYVEGISYREIERILGVSHVSVMNWVKQYGIKRPLNTDNLSPSYQFLNHEQLSCFTSKEENLLGHGMIITEVGEKFMVIQWRNNRKPQLEKI